LLLPARSKSERAHKIAVPATPGRKTLVSIGKRLVSIGKRKDAGAPPATAAE
jgi:hypothetical protein